MRSDCTGKAPPGDVSPWGRRWPHPGASAAFLRRCARQGLGGGGCRSEAARRRPSAAPYAVKPRPRASPGMTRTQAGFPDCCGATLAFCATAATPPLERRGSGATPPSERAMVPWTAGATERTTATSSRQTSWKTAECAAVVRGAPTPPGRLFSVSRSLVERALEEKKHRHKGSARA